MVKSLLLPCLPVVYGSMRLAVWSTFTHKAKELVGNPKAYDVSRASQGNFPANKDQNGNNVVNDGVSGKKLFYDVPSTFCYQALSREFCTFHNSFLWGSIDSLQEKRDEGNELPVDMLPGRQPLSAVNPIMEYERGQTIWLPIKWRDQHYASCEINIWYDQMKSVCPAKRPYASGGGFMNSRARFTMPFNTPGCKDREDGCFIQLYCHSVETQTYVVSIHFTLRASPAAISPTRASQDGLETPSSPSKKFPSSMGQELLSCEEQKPIWFSDSYDSSHSDSEFSVYRGQQAQFVLPDIKAAIAVRRYLGNGGLVDKMSGTLESKRRQMQNQYNNAIVAQSQGGNSNCNVEKILFGTIDPCSERNSKKPSFVVKVDYVALADIWVGKMQAAGLTAYSAKTKSGFETPVDSKAYRLGDGSASNIPKSGKKQICKIPAPPCNGMGFIGQSEMVNCPINGGTSYSSNFPEYYFDATIYQPNAQCTGVPVSVSGNGSGGHGAVGGDGGGDDDGSGVSGPVSSSDGVGDVSGPVASDGSGDDGGGAGGAASAGGADDGGGASDNSSNVLGTEGTTDETDGTPDGSDDTNLGSDGSNDKPTSSSSVTTISLTVLSMVSFHWLNL